MEPQLVNLILEGLKVQGAKLDGIKEDVTAIKATIGAQQHEDRIQKLESVAWYAKATVGVVGFVGFGAVLKFLNVL